MNVLPHLILATPYHTGRKSTVLSLQIRKSERWRELLQDTQLLSGGGFDPRYPDFHQGVFPLYSAIFLGRQMKVKCVLDIKNSNVRSKRPRIQAEKGGESVILDLKLNWKIP